jgi:hypothetical protein
MTKYERSKLKKVHFPFGPKSSHSKQAFYLYIKKDESMNAKATLFCNDAAKDMHLENVLK